MKIELTNREIFAISRSLGKIKKRRVFGTINLSHKIYEQLKDNISKEELESIRKEWDLTLVENIEKSNNVKLFMCRDCRKHFKVKNFDKKKQYNKQKFEPISDEELDCIETF